jgi:hypothetical protein
MESLPVFGFTVGWAAAIAVLSEMARTEKERPRK